jgi:thiol-disulfide isomerase/thioredoxin
MAGKTKKNSKGAKGTLTVDSIKKIPALEKALKSGKINIILVFAEWCGACHKFRKNIWEPMLKKNAIHNRVAVRDDMVANTSLNSAKFDYLPSILIVDEKGKLQDFETPDGQATNAMPTPKSVEDMTRVVNVSVEPMNTLKVVDQPQGPPPEYLDVSPNTNADMEIIKTTPTKTPSGIVYKPTPLVAPPQQKGGALLQTLEAAARGMLPIRRKTRRSKKGRK